MKYLYIRIIMLMGMVLAMPNYAMAQIQLCEKCNCKGEGIEGEEIEGVEDVEFGAEVGEEGSEVSLEGADILGAEFGEEVGAEVATEVVELEVEELSLLALDAIPGVGEILIALEVAAAVGTFIYEIVKASNEVHRQAEEQRIRRARSGPHGLPLMPNFSFHVDDLDSTTDIISAIFTFKTKIDRQDVQNYHRQHGIHTSAEVFDINAMNDNMSNALNHYGKGTVGSDEYAVFHRNINKIELSLRDPNDNSNVVSMEGTLSDSGTNFYPVQTQISSLWTHAGYPHLNLTATSPMILTLATLNSVEGGNGYEMLTQIPYTVELIDDRIAIKIKEFDVSPYTNEHKLYILVQGMAYNYYADIDSNKEFPIDGIHGNHTPEISYQTFAHFVVRDFQAKDTEETANRTNDNGRSYTNPFPALEISEQRSFDDGFSLTDPDPGNTDIRIGIPVREDWKHIDHVEFEVLNRPLTVYVNFKPNIISNQNTLNYPAIKAYYNDAFSSQNELNIGMISYAEDGHESFQQCNNHSGTCSVEVADESQAINWILQNVPVRSGDVLNVTTFYVDQSFSRDVLLIPSGGTLERAYYTLEVQSLQQVTEANLLNGEWLVEHQGNGVYALMNKDTEKVLGMEEGIVGTFDWDPDNEDLLWYMEFTDGGQQLKNLGHQAYLLDDGTSLGFSFSQGTNFLFEKTMDIEEPNLFEEKPQLLINRNSEAVIGMGVSGYPALIRPNVEQANTDQFTYLTYSGCLRYTLQNDGTQKFLNYDMQQEKLSWEDQQATYWLLEEVSGDNDIWFTLKTNEMPLYGTGANGENSTLKVIPGMDATEQERNRDHFTVLPVPNGDLVAHYTFDGNVRDRSGYSHHGSLRKGATLVNDEVRGQVAYFDGVDDYVDLATVEQLNLKEHSFTVGAWINAENLYNDKGILGTKGLRDGTRFEREGLALMTRDTNPMLAFYYHDTRDGTVLNTNTWYYLTYIYDNDLKEQRIYVNGQPQAVGEDRENFVGTGQVTLGKALWGMHFKGKMDEVKIWKKVLTADEVLKEYGVLDQSLIAHYPFDGDVTDHSGYNHHGTSENSTAFVQDEERGQVASFDGQNDFVTLGDKSSLKPAHITIGVWVKYSTNAAGNMIGTEGHGLGINLSQDEITAYAYTYPPLPAQFTTIPAKVREGLNDNEWHHIALTHNGELFNMYLDGSNVGSIDFEGDFPGERGIYYSAGEIIVGSGYEGFMDDLKIWNRALGPEEILEESEDDPAELVAHYAFEGDATDHSGNEHHGAIKNGAAMISDAERGQVAHFDGVDDYADLVSAEELSLHRHSYTVGAWVNAEAIGDNDKIVILGSSDGNRPPGLSLMIREGHPASGIYYNYLPDNGTLLDTDTWYYLTFVYDDVLKEELVYVNGEQRARAQDRENFAGTGLVTLGKSLDPVYNGAAFNGAAFKGKLDDVKIWNYPLNDHQIGVEYQQSKAGNGSDQASALKASLIGEGKTLGSSGTDGQVTISPNPTTGMLSIECTLGKASPVSVRLVDLSGMVLYEHMENAQTGPYRFILDDMNKYARAKGVYVVALEIGQSKFSRKVILR